MTRYSANLSMLFTALPFPRRFDAAAAAGFDTVEFWWPNAAALEGLTLAALAQRIRDAGVAVDLLNFDAGDMPRERGIAGVPGRADQFRDGVPLAIDLASQVGCRKLNALAGNASSAAARPGQLDLLVESVAFAADAAADAGMTVLLESLNPVDTPAYLLLDTATVRATLDRVARSNAALQLDAYHVAMAGEDPVAAIRASAGRIGHVQFADVPGRHEPGSGTLAWAAILAALRDAGYDGVIGLEYQPSDPATPDFAFVPSIGGALRRRG